MFEIFHYIHGALFDLDRIPMALGAFLVTLVIGMITGPLSGNAYPYIWSLYDRLCGRLGDRMDNTKRKKNDLMLRGFIFVTGLLLGIVIVVNGLAYLLPFSFFIEVAILSLCLSSGAVWFIVLQIYFGFDRRTEKHTRTLSDASYKLAVTTRTDLNSTDDYGIVRESLGCLSMSFDKAVVAPVIWYVIGGLPFVLVYSVLAFAVWRFGKCGFSSGFGEMIIAMEKLMGVVPSAFTGFLIICASVVTPTAKFFPAIMSWWSLRYKIPYAQGGVVSSAMSCALDVTLGGAVRCIDGNLLQKAWVGPNDATAQVTYAHLKRGIFTVVIAHLLFVLALLCTYVYGNMIA